MKTVHSVYTLVMNIIYLSHSTQVAEGTPPPPLISLLRIVLTQRLIYVQQSMVLIFYSLVGSAFISRKASKKPICYGPVHRRGWGRGQPPGCNQNSFFFLKEKKMQNVLMRKNRQKYFVTFLQGYLLKTFL